MTSLIVDHCYYTQLALRGLLQINAPRKSDIVSLTTIDELRRTGTARPADLVFINEDCFTHDVATGEILRAFISTHSDTLFFIFISKENLNYQNYIPIRNNIIILSKSIRTQCIGRLIEHYLHVEDATTYSEKLDLTPVRLSRTEADILRMWMSGHDTLHISQRLNIKQKTVSSHKGNIKRKVKTQNKQAIYHVMKLTNALTTGVFVGRVSPFRQALSAFSLA